MRSNIYPTVAAAGLLLLYGCGSAGLLRAQCTSTATPAKEYIHFGNSNRIIEERNVPQSLGMSPFLVSLQPGQTQQFVANNGGTVTQGVTWNLSPSLGTISPSGLYTAPASIPLPQLITVSATSTSDPTQSTCGTIGLLPVIAIGTTPSFVALGSGESVQLSAVVSGTSLTGVRWTVNPAVGTITQQGLYTAPTPLPFSQFVTVTATSLVDPTKMAGTIVGLTTTGVAINPPTAILLPAQSQQFRAAVGNTSNQSVSWSISPAIGSIDQTGLYQAPAQSAIGPQTVTVTAVSQNDPTKSASATITLPAPAVTPGNLAPGWVERQVGSNSNGNSATYANGVYTITSSGGGLGGTSDSGYEYVTQEINTVGIIQARIVGGQFGSGAFAGLVLRDNNTDGSAPGLFVGAQPSSLMLAWRPQSGASTSTALGAGIGAPYWLRIFRNGASLSAYYSVNGIDWTQLGDTQQLQLGKRVYVGMAVVGNCCGSTSVQFDNLWVSSYPDFFPVLTSPTWTSSIAGDTGHFQIGLGTLQAFDGYVNLSIAGLPAGVSAEITPQTLQTGQFADVALTTAPETPPGSYALTVNANDGGTTHTAPLQLQIVNGASGSLPSGWANYAIGQSGSENANYANGVFTLSNNSGNFGGTSDGGYEFVAQPMVGDGTIQARITGVHGPNTLAGLLLRTGPSPTAAGVFAGFDNWGGQSNVAIWSRPDIAQNTSTLLGPNLSFPFWIRLLRSGSTVSSYYSFNGVDWTALGAPQTVTLGTTTYVGMAVSNTCCGPSTVSFDNVSTNLTPTADTSSDFDLSVPEQAPSTEAGGSLTFTADVVPTGASDGPVAFAINGLPAGASADFSPTTLTGGGTTTLTINTAANGPIGEFTAGLTASSGALSHTANITFSVEGISAQPPAVVTVNPSQGSGTIQNFNLTVSDPESATNISWVEALINGSLNGVQACYVHYDTASNILYLRDDSAPEWAASGPLGGSPVLSNSQCSISLSGSSVTTSGAQLRLNLDVSFAPSFAGLQNVYVLVDSGDLNSGWTLDGSWNVPTSLPSGWSNYSIGQSVSNSATYANGVFTLSNEDGNFGGIIDAGYEFVAQPMLGDGTVQARITGVNGPNTLAGLLLRTGPSAGAPGVLVGYENGGGSNNVAVWTRPDIGQTTTSLSGPTMPAPFWVRLVRSGTAVSSYYSVNGIDWTALAAPQTLALGTKTYVGLAVVNGCCGPSTVTFDNLSISTAADFSLFAPVVSDTASDSGDLAVYKIELGALNGFTGSAALSITGLPAGATGQFAPPSISQPQDTQLNVLVPSGTADGTYPLTVTATSGGLTHTLSLQLQVANGASGAPPSGWANYVVGQASSNSSTYSSGVFTLSSNGGNFGGVSDAGYEFVAQPMVGDGTVQARITGVSGPNTLAGLLLRTGPTATAAGVFVGYSNWWGQSNVAVWSRPDIAQNTTTVSGPSVTAPFWVRLVRSGTTVSSYYSLNAVNWTAVGTPQTIALGSTTYVGMAVVNGCCGPSTVSFDNVNVSPFWLLVGGTSAAVQAGATATVNVLETVSANFSDPVTYTVAGLPIGVNASFNPATIVGSGNTTLTLSAGSGASAGDYPLTIVGTDAVSGAVVSIPISLLVTPAGSAATPSATGLQLWLKADSITGVADQSPLGAWPDSSPNSLTVNAAAGNVSFAANGINGLPAVSFAGASLTIQGGVPVSPQYSAFVVMKNNVVGPKGTLFSGSSAGAFDYWTGGIQQGSDVGGWVQLGYGTQAPDTTWHQMNVTFDSSAGALNYRLDQMPDATRGFTNHAPGTSINLLGANFNGEHLSGDIAELLIYNRILTSSEIATIESYFNAKYALSSSFSLTLPQASTTGTAGDSLAVPVTQGAAASFADPVNYSVQGLPVGVTAFFNPGTVTGIGNTTLNLSIGTSAAAGTYPLTIVGTDVLSGAVVSVPLTLNVTPPPSSSSPSTNGLQLWLKADSITGVADQAPVNTWPDSSPNALSVNGAAGTVTFVANALNGMPAASFSGSSMAISGGLPLSPRYSAFVVMKNNVVGPKGTIFSSTSAGAFDYWTGGIQQGSDLGGWVQLGYGTQGPDTNWHQMNVTFDSSAGALNYRLDQMPDATRGFTNQAPGTSINLIGANYNGESLSGDIAELLIYNRVLSPSEIATIETYFDQKYGLSASSLVVTPELGLDPETTIAPVLPPHGLMISSTSPAGCLTRNVNASSFPVVGCGMESVRDEQSLNSSRSHVPSTSGHA